MSFALDYEERQIIPQATKIWKPWPDEMEINTLGCTEVKQLSLVSLRIYVVSFNSASRFFVPTKLVAQCKFRQCPLP